MAKSKKNKFDKSNRYFDDFENQNFKKRKILKNRGVNEGDFQEELDNYYSKMENKDFSASDFYFTDENDEELFSDNEDEK